MVSLVDINISLPEGLLALGSCGLIQGMPQKKAFHKHTGRSEKTAMPRVHSFPGPVHYTHIGGLFKCGFTRSSHKRGFLKGISLKQSKILVLRKRDAPGPRALAVSWTAERHHALPCVYAARSAVTARMSDAGERGRKTHGPSRSEQLAHIQRDVLRADVFPGKLRSQFPGGNRLPAVDQPAGPGHQSDHPLRGQ